MNLTAAETLLLMIDVQNDFCPAYTSALGVHGEGALAVKDGGGVVSPLNALSAAISAKGGRVAVTQDWHPAGHVSFASSHKGTKPGDFIETSSVKGQALWPDHCVQGTPGAAFHDELNLKPVSLIIRKGFRKGLDSYSAFFENDRITSTGLEGWIRSLGITTVVLGGLAADYCVFFSAIDCKKLGFDTIVASDAVRGVEIPDGSVEKAIATMKSSGIGFIPSTELLGALG
jgi:nicotinamidase/pyrazinamidase